MNGASTVDYAAAATGNQGSIPAEEVVMRFDNPEYNNQLMATEEKQQQSSEDDRPISPEQIV
eukprot:CAMPEP_0170487708 /NCGR_PEP_ID=MMETSP0208-20121228/6461_1 /TAXON_ID=197538 /ORGANISM="Strombidium inclinatum, Strain S3" /LENGTH=61 /DNA_ID=CAMNT_0010762077 /DNA_START=994 /DNA_END=1175 /DNA_ORIENTATION=+